MEEGIKKKNVCINVHLGHYAVQQTLTQDYNQLYSKKKILPIPESNQDQIRIFESRAYEFAFKKSTVILMFNRA